MLISSLPLSVTLCNTFAQQFFSQSRDESALVGDVTIHESHAHRSAGSLDNNGGESVLLHDL
jgi:hypothetical protein